MTDQRPRVICSLEQSRPKSYLNLKCIKSSQLLQEIEFNTVASLPIHAYVSIYDSN